MPWGIMEPVVTFDKLHHRVADRDKLNSRKKTIMALVTFHHLDNL